MSKIVKIEVRINGATVGHAAMSSNGLCAFEYSSEWLASGYSISPLELPLKEGVMLAKPAPFHGNFGVFDDALPDGWGMLLLDRYLRLHGTNPSQTSILDLLTYVGTAGRGALEFYPDKSSLTLTETNNLDALCHHASELLKKKNMHTHASHDDAALICQKRGCLRGNTSVWSASTVEPMASDIIPSPQPVCCRPTTASPASTTCT